MNWLIALAIFLCSIGDDILCVFYYRRVNTNDRKLQASILSGILTATVSFGVFFYVQEIQYIIPNILGSMVGTPLAIWIDSRWPSRKKSRDSKGRFKPPTIPPQMTLPFEKGL